MSNIVMQEIFYKSRITYSGIKSLKETFSGLFLKLDIIEESKTCAILEITTENSINPFYTPMKIKRRIKDQLYSRALLNIKTIESIDFKEEAEIYDLD